jgi:hypothetical protein
VRWLLPKPPRGSSRGGSRLRILIAQDDQLLADGLLRALRNGDYAADRVDNGPDADAALAPHDPAQRRETRARRRDPPLR